MNLESAPLIISILSLLLSLLTVWIIYTALSTWKRQLIGTKRADIAENTLSLFLEAWSHISDSRNPGVSAEEVAEVAQGRLKDKNEILLISGSTLIIKAAVYTLRFEKQKDFWQKFKISQYKFMANFVPDCPKASDLYQKVLDIKREIIWAAEHFIQLKLQQKDPQQQRVFDQEPETKKEFDNFIALNQEVLFPDLSNKPDKIDEKLDNILTELEKICLPYLQAK